MAKPSPHWSNKCSVDPVNFIDILALVAVGYGVFRGFRNGVIYEIAGMLGLVVGVWAGMRLAFIFADYYRDNTNLPDPWIPLLAFLTAFLLGLGLVYLVGRLATQIMKTVQLNMLNRLAGGAFGGLKWALIIGIAITMLGSSKIIPEETQAESTTYPILDTYTKTVQGYSIGLIPQAQNVFQEMDNYFVGLDSVRKANREMAPESGEESEEN